MKKLLISLRLIRQALRRLLVPGLILLGVALVISQLSLANDDRVPILPTGSFAIMTYGAFILAICAFAFLRTRRGSDFYHSIPMSRTNLYLAGLAAVLIWLIGIVAIDIAAHYLVLFFKGSMADYYYTGGEIATIVMFLLSCLRIVAATLMVCAATGTLSANVLVTGVLLVFSPSMIISIYQGVLQSQVGGILPAGGMYPGALSGVSFLLPLLYPSLFLFAQGASLYSVSGVNWVFAIGTPLLYLAVGWVLFVRRKSEVAGHGAAANWMHRICRFAVTLPFIAYIPVVATSSENAVGLGVVLGCAAAVAYFGYELLTTRRLASVVRAAPLFLVVIALAVVASMSMGVAENIVLAYRPTAEQVSSIKLHTDTTVAYDDIYSFSTNEYRQHLISRAPITDDRAQQIICQALERDLEQRNARYEYGIEDHLEWEKTPCVVAIKSGWLTRNRVVRLTKEELRDVVLYSAETGEDFHEAMTSLPQAGDGVTIMVEKNHTSYQDAAVYETFCREFATLTIEQILAISCNAFGEVVAPGVSLVPTPVITISIPRGETGASYILQYFISPDLLPETYAKIKAATPF